MPRLIVSRHARAALGAVGAGGSLLDMTGWDEVTTYEQLQAMTPQERTAHFRASVVRDPSTLSPAARHSFERLTEALNEDTTAREEQLRGHAS